MAPRDRCGGGKPGRETRAGAQTRVVLTDGEASYVLAWIKHTSTNVYLFHGGSGYHTSYHASGKVHDKQKGEILSQYEWVPLAELRGTLATRSDDGPPRGNAHPCRRGFDA